MLPPLQGQLASLPPPTSGCRPRTTTTFPPPRGWPAGAPLCPAPASGSWGLVSLLRCHRKCGAWRSGASRQLLPWGPSSPALGLASLRRAPERRGGRQSRGGGGVGEGQAFPVYVTTRPPRKGKDLESALLLGGLQLASVCGSQPRERIPGAGRDSFPGGNGHPALGGAGVTFPGLAKVWSSWEAGVGFLGREARLLLHPRL